MRPCGGGRPVQGLGPSHRRRSGHRLNPHCAAGRGIHWRTVDRRRDEYIRRRESIEQVSCARGRMGLGPGAGVAGPPPLAARHRRNRWRRRCPPNWDRRSIRPVCGQSRSAPGTGARLAASAAEMIRWPRAGDFCCCSVGQVTKEGMIAGPRVLEMVDTVAIFEAKEATSSVSCARSRTVRPGQRGSAVFEMTDAG